MNIVAKNVVTFLNNWSFLQMMKMDSHVRRVVTGIRANSCLHFHVDRPREAEISAAICQQRAQHHQEDSPEHLSPNAAVSCDSGP